jgi:hypothetical protein
MALYNKKYDVSMTTYLPMIRTTVGAREQYVQALIKYNEKHGTKLTLTEFTRLALDEMYMRVMKGEI